MAWYTTGTIAVSGTNVTGTGTNFLDNTQSIGPGQALLIPGSGTVKMYEVASVQSATKLTLKTSAGTIAAGQAYAILSFYTDSVPDFARRLAAQLSYYQSQMDGWQQIMTGTGSITMTAPDGTTVTISSFSKLTADVASAFLQKGVIATGVDTNSLGSDSFGIWSIGSTAAQSNPNLPEANQGVLEVIPGGLYGCTQRFTARYGNVWVRTLGATWNASSPTWNTWNLVGDQPVQGYAADCNACITPGTYSITASSGNNAPLSATGILEVKLRLSANSVVQRFTTITTGSTTINRTWQRTLSGTTWTAWAESLTTNSVVAIANGGTGANTVASALNNLGIGPSSGPTFTSVELSSDTPYIDFHVGSTNANYDTRLINSSAGYLDLMAASGNASLRVYGGYRCRNGTAGAFGNSFNFFWNTSSQMEVWVDTSRVGAITLASVSDKQLKKEINYYDKGNALGEVLQWRPATFRMKERGIIPESEIKLGFIANDLVAISSECVSGQGLPDDYDIDKEPNREGAYNLDEVAMIAKLTMAIQVQQEKIDSQNEIIAELQVRMKAIDGLDA